MVGAVEEEADEMEGAVEEEWDEMEGMEVEEKAVEMEGSEEKEGMGGEEAMHRDSEPFLYMVHVP
jgi:hypothetical protein